MKYSIHPQKTPEFTPIQKSLQLIFVSFWIVLTILLMTSFIPLTIALTFYPWTGYLLAIYMMWIWLDRNTANTGLKSFARDTLRFNKSWQLARDYFSGQLVKTHELDPSRKYIFGYHPHGLLGIALQVNILLNHNFRKIFPGIDTIIATVSVSFWIPFWRDYILNLGAISCDPKAVRNCLINSPKGTALVLALGGAEEFQHMDYGTVCSLLTFRWI